MKISVITVCYQAENSIAQTVESLCSQTYQEIEYIIVDGNSTDRTLEIAKDTLKGFPVKIISEPDRGIYDAMNKGVHVATGDYVHFLNAGDKYYSPDILEEVAFEIEKTHADILYGDIEYWYPDGSRGRRIYDAKCAKQIYYLTGDCINHQAMFARRKLFEKKNFDINLRICADRDWMMYQSKNKVSYYPMGFIVCAYSYDGTSVIQKEQYNKEAKDCIKRHYPKGYPIYAFFEFMRNSKVLSKVLHDIYKILFIKK